MHEVQLIVTCQVDSDGQLTESQSVEAALDAVSEALNHAMNRGFVHRHADVASVGIADVRPKIKTVICDICNNETDIPIAAMYLDGEDVDQPMELSMVCPHCYRTEVNAPGWGWAPDYNDAEKYERDADGKWFHLKEE